MVDFLGLGILGILGLAFVLNLVLLYVALVLFKWIYNLIIRCLGIEIIIKRKNWLFHDKKILEEKIKKKGR
jgi:hypothetical protein